MSGGWLLLDLDGPLLDVLPRYHRLHSDLVRRSGGRPLEEVAYWQLKRKQVPEARILEQTGLDPAVIPRILGERARRIESRRYLRLDRPWSWTETTLARLSRLAPLILVTSRRHRDRLLWQLRELHLRDCFHRIVSGCGDATPEGKAVLVRDSRLPVPPGSIFVGDTEVDLASARSLGLRTVALSCGIRSADALSPWEPDALLEDLRGLQDYLLSLGWRESDPEMA